MGEGSLELRQRRQFQKFRSVGNGLRPPQFCPGAGHPPCAAARRVADRLNAIQQLQRQKSDPAGTFRTDEAAESTGKQDPLNGLHPAAQLRRHQFDAGRDGALGHLQLTDVVLRQINAVRQAETPLPLRLENPVAQRKRRPRLGQPSPGVYHARIQQHRGNVNQAGAADASGLPAADHGQGQRISHQCGVVNGPRLSPHTEADFRAL